MAPMTSPAAWNTRATPAERMPIDLRIAISLALPITSIVIAAMMLNAATRMISVRMIVMRDLLRAQRGEQVVVELLPVDDAIGRAAEIVVRAAARRVRGVDVVELQLHAGDHVAVPGERLRVLEVT